MRADRLAAVIGALCALAWTTGPSAAAEPRSVSSDGRGLAVAQAKGGNTMMSASYAGRGGEASEASAAALAEFRATRDSASEVERLQALSPASAPIGAETIIGKDERTKVNNTKQFPYRAVVLITYENYRCTGWMIGKDTVATAGHCVHTGNGGRWYKTSTYRIYPGRNGNASPYGSCTAKRLYSNTGWTQSGDSRHDYGAIKLNCDIGKTVGWFGYFWEKGTLNGLPALVSGYPGDKPLTQWKAKGKVKASNDNEVFYPDDTYGGMSGSPVYYDRKKCGICSMAVHAYGTYGKPPYSKYNHGTRITKSVFQQFNSWVAAK